MVIKNSDGNFLFGKIVSLLMLSLFALTALRMAISLKPFQGVVLGVSAPTPAESRQAIPSPIQSPMLVTSTASATPNIDK